MKKYVSLICLALCIVLLAGCAGTTAMPGQVKWEMSAEEVKSTVGADKLQESTTGGILNQMLTKDYVDLYGDRTVSLAYVFNKEDKLSSITVQIFTNDGETIEDAMKNVRTVMEGAYGAGDGEGSAVHWHTKDAAIGMQSVEGATSFFVVVYQPISAHSH